MPPRRYLSQALSALTLAALALAAPALAAGPTGAAEHPLYLRDGRTVTCREAPRISYGRVLYVTPDGRKHTISETRVDGERTAAMGASIAEAASTVLASPASPPGAGSSAGLAPDFEAKTLAGTTIKLSDLRGKVVLVDFWASWCGPCVRQMPAIKALHAKHGGESFEVIGVSLDRTRDKFESYVRSQGLPWPQVFDGKSWATPLARTYGVRAIPRTVLIDREGRIARVNLHGAHLEQAVAELIGRAPTTARSG